VFSYGRFRLSFKPKVHGEIINRPGRGSLEEDAERRKMVIEIYLGDSLARTQFKK
jgi:hypothetical protein